MQDNFCNKFNEDFLENELYITLTDEMSKYKTLMHDSIKWDYVFSSSLKALSEFSLDAKLLNFLAISAINLNDKEAFKTLIKAFAFFLSILKKEPNSLAKNEKWEFQAVLNTNETKTCKLKDTYIYEGNINTTIENKDSNTENVNNENTNNIENEK